MRGRVTYAGKPVPRGRVCFWPEQGHPALGEIQPDGGYTLTTFEPGDGAVPGKCCVTIEAVRVSGGAAALADVPPPDADRSGPGAAPPPSIERLVPVRYERRETSPLTAEVRRGQNEIDFDLPAESVQR